MVRISVIMFPSVQPRRCPNHDSPVTEVFLHIIFHFLKISISFQLVERHNLMETCVLLWDQFFKSATQQITDLESFPYTSIGTYPQQKTFHCLQSIFSLSHWPLSLLPQSTNSLQSAGEKTTPYPPLRSSLV
jgi:hypothetical protein